MTLMLVAMMLPLQAAAVRHLRARGFARRRGRATALFVAGYAAVWMLAGIALAAAAARYHHEPVAIAAAWSIAIVWQCSPLKRVCLNRCHALSALPAFGLAADVGALRYGATRAVWCVGSCWAMMLPLMLVPHGGFLPMAAVMFWVAAERIERPAAPRWELVLPRQASRIAVAYARAIA